MNARERYYEVTHYGDPDRLFLYEMRAYEETVKRWQKEGLPPDTHYQTLAGYDRYEIIPVQVGVVPAFDCETLEWTGVYEIYRDRDGVIKKRHRAAKAPAMPQYLEYPLKSREDWPEFKKRLDPESPARFAVFWDSIKGDYESRHYPLGINAGSIFGWLRNWAGLVGISYLLYDDPAFIEQAADNISYCTTVVLKKVVNEIQFDFATFWEDMAYKTASLIDPKLYRKLFFKSYRRIVDVLRGAGIDILTLDSDGNVEELIPVWLDCGINYVWPMEVAAGMDVVELRKKFGKDLLLGGGMDKRVLATSRAAIRRMVEEKIDLMQEGGYIPGVDHAIPPDIPWENFLYFRKLLAEVRP